MYLNHEKLSQSKGQQPLKSETNLYLENVWNGLYFIWLLWKSKSLSYSLDVATLVAGVVFGSLSRAVPGDWGRFCLWLSWALTQVQEIHSFQIATTSSCRTQNITNMKTPCDELKMQKKYSKTRLDSSWMSDSNPKTQVKPKRNVMAIALWTLFRISSRMFRDKPVVILPQVNRCMTNPKMTALTTTTRARSNRWVK